MTESPLPSVEGDFVDPFDRLAIKGQSVRPMLPPSHEVRDLDVVRRVGSVIQVLSTGADGS